MPRSSIFISHASPEDNAFTIWLGAKLSAVGYEVFADVLRLRGGDDWERVLEDAIRVKAAKVLLAASPQGVQKQGVRNEITIAADVAKKIGDSKFIVPLRLAPFDAPLLVAHAQYIDFSKGWSKGLDELLALLEELTIPKTNAAEFSDPWRGMQLKDARAITAKPEHLVSNWLAVDSLPTAIQFFDFKGGISIGKAQKAVQDCPIAIAPFNRGFFAFAPLHELQDHFGPDLPLERVDQTETNAFLNEGWSDLRLVPRDARAKFVDIVRRGFDNFFRSKSLKSFELASGHFAWWPTAAHATLQRHSFKWPDGPAGSRQIVGRSNKRGFHWHYGVSCKVRTSPIRHVRVASRVIFTADGYNVFGSPKRLHRMRRSFCKNWRNGKWRDLFLTFWFWLAAGANFIDIPLGEGVAMRLTLPPMGVDAPFGIDSLEDEVSGNPDDDDPDSPSSGADDEVSDDDSEDLDDEE
jgi:hypothetical protein